VKALVIGVTGFVGGALARRLLAQGASLRVLVRDCNQAESFAEAGAEVFVGTIGDPNEVAQAASGCEVLYHCAGESSHHASERALQWINIAGTENVVHAARHARCRRVVYLSCADVSLLNCERIHWKENRSLLGQPLDPCARSKLLAEELALLYSSKATEVTALRPAWVWGPGERRVLPELCLEAQQGGINLFGKGSNLIATTYIDNLVDALLVAAEAPGVAQNAYYLSDGEFLEAREFFGMLSQSLGLPRPRTGSFALSYALACLRELLQGNGPWRADVILRGRTSLFDTLKATEDFGYRPKVTVAEGMGKLGQWAKSIGGPNAIAQTKRSPATDESVASQIAHARAFLQS
jgi:nucleoside-diphosphate-sugar epimerase